MKLRRNLIGLGMMFAVVACSGVEYHFDPGVAPAWTRGGNGKVGLELTSVGLSPVTQDVARDRQRALNDAKAKIGQLVNSRVESVHKDFMASGFMGAKGTTSSVQVQTLRVESVVELGEVQTLASFRDEDTRTQYVQIGVDRARWLSAVEEKLKRRLQSLQSSLEQAQVKRSDGKLIQLVALRNEMRSLLKEIKSTIAVAEAIGTQEDWRQKVRSHEADFETVLSHLRDGVRTEVLCEEPKGGQSCAGFVRGIKEFMRSIEVGVENPNAAVLRFKVVLKSADEGQSKVGDRVEYKHSSGYTVRVFEPGERESGALRSERLTGERISRAGSVAEVQRLAIEVAGEDALAAVRSKIRKSIALKRD